MNNLVKLLIEDLLNGDSKTVAIFGGGFKPPTAGHLEVVKNTLSQFPEINELIVFVGGGIRDGITQAESLDIWNIYKKHLPSNVKIETAVAPVKAVLDYAKNNPENKVYWILGTREGNEGDIKDIIERTKSVGKYPNIEVKIINTNNSTSGTKARQALKANNKEEFLQYIPNIPEQEEIWNIVSPVIKEEVTDTEVICDKCGWHWPIADGGDDLYICHKCEHDNTPSLNEVGEGSAEPFAWKAEGNLTSFINKLKKRAPDSDKFKYSFSSDNAKYDVTAYVQMFETGIYDIDVSFGFNIQDDETDATTNFQEQYRVLATVMQIVVDFVNNVNSMKNVVVSQIKITPKSDKDNSYTGDVDSKRGKFYKAYIEKNLNKLNKNYTLDNTSSTFILQIDNDQLNENQNKAWNLKEGIVSLSKYMLDNGLNIKPLPKVKFINNDEENASNMLGKTAYYNPSEKSITLYTFGRHPKDILRSFSHEMIHHHQNLDNRLNNINTTNTNEDGDLPELEREAYEKGNMMLRNWEDSIKNV